MSRKSLRPVSRLTIADFEGFRLECLSECGDDSTAVEGALLEGIAVSLLMQNDVT